jgi:hypothetical protein
LLFLTCPETQQYPKPAIYPFQINGLPRSDKTDPQKPQVCRCSDTDGVDQSCNPLLLSDYMRGFVVSMSDTHLLDKGDLMWID